MNFINNIRVTKISEVITVTCADAKHYEMTDRKSYGLSFCMSGKITYNHNGKKFVSDPYHAVFFPKGASYTRYSSGSTETQLINFYCTEDFVLDEFVCVPIRSIEGYLHDFQMMKQLFVLQNNTRVMSIFYDMLDRLQSEKDSATGALAPSVRYIEERYADPMLSIKDIAEKSGISEVHFRKCFRRQYGTSPKQYIITLRINRSRQLLEEQQMTVTEISAACGFAGVYHFCRTFKAVTGETPSQYRSQHKL